MQSQETNNPSEATFVPLVDSEAGKVLRANELLARANSTVESVAAKGMQDAEAVAVWLGEELDDEVRRDLHVALGKLESAQGALAKSLSGEGNEPDGTADDAMAVRKAAEFILGPNGLIWTEHQVAALQEQGYTMEQVIKAYMLVERGDSLIRSFPELSFPKQEFFDEIACIPGGLELLNDRTAAMGCLSTSVFARIVGEPGGVNRGFKYLKFFSNPEECIWENQDAIEREEHLDQLLLLTALGTFPELTLDEVILSSLKRSEMRAGDEEAIRRSATSIALFEIGITEIAVGIDILASVGLLEACRADREFLKKALDSIYNHPDAVVELARVFPEIGIVVKQSERDRKHAELQVTRVIQNKGEVSGLSEIVSLYGLTWDSIAKNHTVQQWMAYPFNGALAHAELQFLLELMKPSREQIMKSVTRALVTAIDSPQGYVDVTAYHAIQETFGLSEAERATVRLEDVGYAHVKDMILTQKDPVPVAKRVCETCEDKDAMLARFRSREMQDLVWPSFEEALRGGLFAGARALEFFGLDTERMAELARERYVGLLEGGASKSLTNDLVWQFGIDLEDIPQSKIDHAIRRGIWNALTYNHLPLLAEFVASHEVSVESAKIEEYVRSRVDLLMKENISSYLQLSEPHRAKLSELFGLSVASLHDPDATPYLEKQATAMIREQKDALVALREAVPRIIEQEWYLGAARKLVYEFVRDGKGQDTDVRAFVAGVQKLTGLPAWPFRSPEIISVVQEFVRDNLTAENYEAVTQYVEAFGVSVREGIVASIEDGRTAGLFQFGTLIDQSSVDAWKQGKVRTALEMASRGNPMLGNQLTGFYTSRRNFNGLAMAIDLGLAGVPYPDESDALRELQKLVTSGEAAAAEGLLKCYGLGGKMFDAGLRDRIKHAALVERKRRTNREAVALDKNKHSIERELAGFYLDEWIGFELSSLERRAQQKNVDLDFSAKIQAYDLKNIIRANTETQFVWMREYLVRAVHGELKHQSEFGQAKEWFVAQPADPDAWMSRATNEEIRQYMASAKARFLEPGWGISYGGGPWAQIAATAEMMFSETPDKHKLVDAVYDLQHNNGTVFNKESDRVEQMENAKIIHVLSAKREVSDPEAYLALLEREIEPETFAETSRRWSDWKEIRTKIEREIDGREVDRRAEWVESVRNRSSGVGVDSGQLASRLNEMETEGLKNFISSKLLNAGRAGRAYLRKSAEEAINRRVRAFPGGVVGVVERLRRSGANRNAELDVFAPLVSTYLKTRADVIRDTTEMFFAREILGYRNGGAPVGVNQMISGIIPTEIQQIVDAIVGS